MKMKDLISKINEIEILKFRIKAQKNIRNRNIHRGLVTTEHEQHINKLETELTALEEEEIFK